MFRNKELHASLDGIEIGTSGPNRVQMVMRAARKNVTLKLTAAEPRWLASALEQWAADSETISPVRPVGD
jgi:hypothetical protein